MKKTMVGKLLTALLCMCMLLTLLPVTAMAGETPVPVTVQVTCMQSSARTHLKMINDFRTGGNAWVWNGSNTEKIYYNDLQPLEYDYQLERVAMLRALEIAMYWAHERPNGESCFTAYDDLGYSSWASGENIAWGYTTDAEAFERLREDDYPYSGQGHRRNMLDGYYNRVGVGHVVVNGVNFYAQEFAYSEGTNTYTAPVDTAIRMSTEILPSRITGSTVNGPTGTIELSIDEMLTLPAVNKSFTAASGRTFVDYSPARWVSADSTVARVDLANNTITGVKAGNTTITANCLGKTVSMKVTVYGNRKCRISGPDRYDTAMALADKWMAETGRTSLDTVVIACGTNFPDALAGSYLAVKKDAPILLVGSQRQGLNKTMNYLSRKLTAGGTVYILGGIGAVPDEVETRMAPVAGSIIRLAGTDRFETNAAILQEAGVAPGEDLLVVDAHNFADALSASALGKPILLVDRRIGALTEKQRDFIAQSGFGRIFALGGVGAVPETVFAELQEVGGETPVERIGGQTRYETSVNIARRFFGQVDCIALATGTNFPDGLAGGPLAYACHAPLLLTRNNQEAVGVVSDYTKSTGAETYLVFGGTGVMPDGVVNLIMGR